MKVVAEDLYFAIREHTKSVNSLSTSQLEVDEVALEAFFQHLTH